MEKQSRYQFSWELLGDISLGRPNLGASTRLEVYRLMQFTLRDILENRLGQTAADEVFYEAGKLAGLSVYHHLIDEKHDAHGFIRQLQQVYKDFGIGILRFEKTDWEKGELVLTVSEDLDCSGLPELGYEICTYDEGFIAGLLETFTNQEFMVKEIDCWCTGDRTCRFTANRSA